MADTAELTLQEAADALEVHYMTAYRYVRLGLLEAHRRGRSWVVTDNALERFRQERAQGPDDVDGGPRVRPADWCERFERRLLVGDRAGAIGVLEGALSSGADPADLYLDVIAPAMASIGDRWQAGTLDVSVEHRASVIVTQSLAVIGARFHRRGVSRGVVVVGAVEGERHDLPVHLLADVLRLSGYEVEDLGADVPVGSFTSIVHESDRLLAVGVSVTMPDHLDAARATIASVRASVGAPVFAGGMAVADETMAHDLGADHWAPDARAVAELLDAMRATQSSA